MGVSFARVWAKMAHGHKVAMDDSRHFHYGSLLAKAKGGFNDLFRVCFSVW
jgi:hypothetical protein